MDVETHGVQRISIRLRSVSEPTHTAWLTMHVRARDDQQVRAQLELDEILADPLALSQAEKTIIKTEIMGGVLTARRFAKRGCTIDLVAIGAESTDGKGLNGIASIAFAVAANLVVLQGLGVHDLRTEPRGGYGWKLDALEVADAT
jgi:hypothetical protein